MSKKKKEKILGVCRIFSRFDILLIFFCFCFCFCFNKDFYMIMICCKEMMIADENEFADFYMTKEIDSKVV